jgi:hypothetical protein
MHIRFAFSSEWRASPVLTRTPEYQVDRRPVEVTRKAAKILRAQPSSRPEAVSGLIIDLHARYDPMGLFGRSKSDDNVIIAWRPKGSGAEIPVSYRKTLKAVGAHREGLPITVRGMLERRGPRTGAFQGLQGSRPKMRKLPEREKALSQCRRRAKTKQMSGCPSSCQSICRQMRK